MSAELKTSETELPQDGELELETSESELPQDGELELETGKSELPQGGELELETGEAGLPQGGELELEEVAPSAAGEPAEVVELEGEAANETETVTVAQAEEVEEEPAQVEQGQPQEDKKEEEEVEEEELEFTQVEQVGQEEEEGGLQEDNVVELTKASEKTPIIHDENGPLRSQGIIRQMRQERNDLLAQIRELKGRAGEFDREVLGLQAELEDRTIEVSVLKKRHADEVDEMKYRVRLAEEKKLIAEEKMKKLQKEFDRLEGQVRFDVKRIKQREKELESKLEFLSIDSEARIGSREQKILQLKRKIDQLEFNMENAAIREKKSRDDKCKLEERINRIMKTLRGSIELFEDDLEVIDKVG